MSKPKLILVLALPGILLAVLLIVTRPRFQSGETRSLATSQPAHRPGPTATIGTDDAIEAAIVEQPDAPVLSPQDASLICSGNGWLIWDQWGSGRDSYDRQRFPKGVAERLPQATGAPIAIMQDGSVLFVNGIRFELVRPNSPVDAFWPEIDGKWVSLRSVFPDGVVVFPCISGTLGGPYRHIDEGTLYFVPFSVGGLDISNAVAICPKLPGHDPRLTRHDDALFWLRDDTVEIVDLKTKARRSVPLARDHASDGNVFSRFETDGRFLYLDAAIFDLQDGSFVSKLRSDLPTELAFSWQASFRTMPPRKLLVIHDGMAYFTRGTLIRAERDAGKWYLMRLNLHDPHAGEEILRRYPYEGSLTVDGHMQIWRHHPILVQEDGLRVWDGERWDVVNWSAAADAGEDV